MAYMNQEKKARIAATLKTVIPPTWKWSLGVRNHSTIVLTIASAPVDLCAESLRVYNDSYRAQRDGEKTAPDAAFDLNPYHPDLSFDGELLETFKKILAALNLDNYDRSDAMTDYFDVGHYVSVSIGRWNKPFVCTSAKQAVTAA